MALPPLKEALRAAGGNRAGAEALARQVLAGIPPGGGERQSFISLVDELAPAPEGAQGDLAGCVFAVKDNFHLAGTPTSCGSRLFADIPPPQRDADAIALLRSAGAHCVGKTHMDELALAATGANRHYGTTTNPWDSRRGVGGSSGGSAISVAERQVHLALGTDSGGSVRIPASMCGVVGFKPTPGSLPLDGIVGALMSIDCVGLFTVQVADQITVWNGLGLPRGAIPHNPPRLAWLQDHSMGRVAPKVWARYLEAIESLRRQGANLCPISLPGFERAPHICVSVAYPEAASEHAEMIRQRPADYDPAILALLYLGELWSGRQYIDAQRARALLERRFRLLVEPFDAVLTPTVAVQPPLTGQTAQVEGDPPGAELYTLMRFTVPFNVIGYPAISVPAGLDTDGLPVGLQVVGRPGQDIALLEIAQTIETALGQFPLAPAVANTLRATS